MADQPAQQFNLLTEYEGELNALNYFSTKFEGTLQLLDQVPRVWHQGSTVRLSWDVTGNAPHLEAKIKPCDDSAKPWVTIADRVSAGRRWLDYIVPFSLEPGMHRVRIGLRPRSQLSNAFSEIQVEVIRDMQEFSDVIVYLTRPPSAQGLIVDVGAIHCY